jgi:hypothetical protein
MISGPREDGEDSKDGEDGEDGVGVTAAAVFPSGAREEH